jgi:hypothetical protein
LLKTRMLYLIAFIVAICLGLCTRMYSNSLPTFVSSHFGDGLWACMIYFGVRFLLVEKKLIFAILGSLLFCFGIEVSQLYQADWINEIRSTLIGSLVLGHGYLSVDLLRYSVGIIISYLLDKYGIQRSSQ